MGEVRRGNGIKPFEAKRLHLETVRNTEIQAVEAKNWLKQISTSLFGRRERERERDSLYSSTTLQRNGSSAEISVVQEKEVPVPATRAERAERAPRTGRQHRRTDTETPYHHPRLQRCARRSLHTAVLAGSPSQQHSVAARSWHDSNPGADWAGPVSTHWKERRSLLSLSPLANAAAPLTLSAAIKAVRGKLTERPPAKQYQQIYLILLYLLVL